MQRFTRTSAARATRTLARSFSSSTPVLTNYGFIGLGQMGQNMSRHLHSKLKPEDKLFVYDVNAPAITAALGNTKDHGHQQMYAASSVVDVGANCEVVITMLPEGKHVKAVVQEIVDLKKDSPTVFVDSSTIDIPTSQAISQLVREANAGEYLDAPVSGGAMGARDATLSFMIGREGPKLTDDRLQFIFDAMGARIFFMGKISSGLAAKLANNYLLALTNIATADSFNLARTFGLDMAVYAELVSKSTGNSWASATNCPVPGVKAGVPSNDGYKGGFATRLTRKDMVLACQSAESIGQPLFLGAIGKEIYDKACEREDLANRDLAVLYEWLGEMGGDSRVA
ncbi:hypothetical protein BABINDRAFT_162256 [Babjeviella inositovora NRRL Y-12698]|uniref:3-hydroxyisobutyrate dehydrogenase n=1 Tax=Babjeviella inositovora NRRL Y-12698 TaxID=984486 RepID=A0A1E3QQH9_9ASCO|nr:uncharacterized protein BABINDRAFT_162256 [Babjeviella inositovora NRRL Y-12698]ODQ79217.1 hypothetical protein BABINDRAFT_162256 [Babjeviella inositovora NRRL Y-12698]